MSARDLFATLTKASTIDDKANRDALDSLLALGPMGIPMLDVQARSTLTRKQLSDLSPTKPIEDRLAHLKVLKELSRLPGGSNVQAEVTGLKALLGQVHLPSPALAYRRPSTISQASTSSVGATAVASSSLSGVLSRAWSGRKSKDNNSSEDSTRLATPSPTLGRSQSPSSSSPVESNESPAPTPEEWEATDIALRCLNNALFLHETSRRTFTDDSVGGGARKIVGLLKNPSATPIDVLFLAGRLLFYATLFEPDFNRVAVEEEGIVQHLCETLAVLSPSSKASPEQIKAAQSEVLKVVVNVTLYYSSEQQQQRDKEAAGVTVSAGQDRIVDLLEPVIRLLVSYSPSHSSLAAPATPTTGAIGVLLNYPVTQANYSIWTKNCSAVPALEAEPSTSRSSTPTSAFARSSTAARRVATALFSHSESSTPTTIGEPSSAASSTTPSHGAGSVASHLLALLDVTLAHYFAPAHSGEHFHVNGTSSAAATYYEPDSSEVKARAQREGVNLEEVLSPLLLLVRKLAHADVGADATRPQPPLRSAIHQHLFTPSASEPPYRQATALGHLVRLLSSTRYPRLEALSGELLLSACGGDARQLVGEVGYGPLAGWLARSGRAGAVADLAESGASADGGSRHPITGAPATAAASSLSSSNDTANDEMTEEEKEREAERLFDLFDRLNKTGVVSVAHPVRDAPEGSRFQEVNGGEEDEKKEEEEAMREFVQYKERKAGPAAATGAAATTATAREIPHGQQ